MVRGSAAPDDKPAAPSHPARSYLGSDSIFKQPIQASLRALAKQSMRQQRRKRGLLRRFTPRNDVRVHHRLLAARSAPELCTNIVPQRKEGAGKAGCPSHPQPRV
jgi:hypothetical protein